MTEMQNIFYLNWNKTKINSFFFFCSNVLFQTKLFVSEGWQSPLPKVFIPPSHPLKE